MRWYSKKIHRLSIVLSLSLAIVILFIDLMSLENRVFNNVQPLAAQETTIPWIDLGDVVSPATASYILKGVGDGKIVGGTYEGGPLLYMYDSDNNQFTTSITVPRAGGNVEAVARGQGDSVFATISRAYQPGYLVEYNTVTGDIYDRGNVGGEYAYGLTVGLDGRVYVGSCCSGSLRRYNPQSNTWTSLGQTLGNHLRITGLATDSDGWIYAATGSVPWLSNGDASLYRVNPETLLPTHLAYLWPGFRDAWNIAYNAFDDALYMTVSTNMNARLFRYALQSNMLQDLGEIRAGVTDVYPGQMTIADDGRVFITAGSYLYVYDPANGSGIMNLGLRGNSGRALTYGSDGNLYSIYGTHLMRNETLNVTSSISGRVVDDLGQGKNSVLISTDKGQSVLTNINGQYRFSNLPSGTYTITPSIDGFRFAPVTRTVVIPSTSVHQVFIQRPLPEMFLDLPITYINFTKSLGGNYGDNKGLVNSWFDHNEPNYFANGQLLLYSGVTLTETIALDSCNLGFSCYDGHNAIDFQHDYSIQKEPIFAAAPGVVREICRTANCSRGSSYGNYVLIDHLNGYATFYAHLASVTNTLSLSSTITDTQSGPIGIMGGSGGHPVHLHFGVYYDTNGNQKWEETYRGPTEAVDPYGQKKDPISYLWLQPLEQENAADHDGGSITSVSNSATFVLHPGSVSTQVILSLWEAPPFAAPLSHHRSIGHSYWLEVEEENKILANTNTNITEFTYPITVSINYSDTGLSHLDETRLTINRWDNALNSWQVLSSTVDTVQDQVVAQTRYSGNFDLQGPLLCPEETLEPNDNYDGAHQLSPDGLITSLLDGPDDEDWYWIRTEAPKTYALEILDLADGVKPILSLYDSSGITLITTSNMSGLEPNTVLAWKAEADQTYFVQVTQAPSSTHGCDENYSIRSIVLSPYLDIVNSSDDISLSWNHISINDAYEVWRSSAPYLVPGISGTTKLADIPAPTTGLTVTYIDDGAAVGNSDYFYSVIASSAVTDSLSNQTGKIDIQILPNWNLLSLPLLPSDTSLDTVLGTQLYGTEDPQTANRVWVWDGDSQSYQSAWFCSGPVCESWGELYYNHWLDNNYNVSSITLEPDTAFWIQNKSGLTESLTLVGAVAETNRSITVGQGWQMLGSVFPIEKALNDAKISGYGTEDPLTADKIWYWNAQNQTYSSAWYCGGSVCEEWGTDYYQRWLTNNYTITPILLEPGHGFWYQNKGGLFVWNNLTP